MNRIARSNRKQDVLSFARERAWQPRGGSNLHTFIPVGLSANQRLERLEAENAQLRGHVVDLLLQVQALRDDAAEQSGHAESVGNVSIWRE
jgi:hypothetical protein